MSKHTKEEQMGETFEKSIKELRSACGDLLFEIAKVIGLLNIIEKTSFLDYKPWVKRRLAQIKESK